MGTLSFVDQVALLQLIALPVLYIAMPVIASLSVGVDRTSFFVVVFFTATLCFSFAFSGWDSDNPIAKLLANYVIVPGFFGFLVLGLLIKALKRQQPEPSTPFGRILFALVFGGFLPPLLLLWHGLMSRWPGELAFFVLGVVILFCFTQSAWNIPLAEATFRRSLPRQSFFALGVSTFLIASFALYTATEVSIKAADTAGNKHYCIQPAQSFIDLSILTLRDANLRRSGRKYHALLVIGATTEPALFNWSYRQWRFAPDRGRNSFQITCLPE